jgi:hypothetical protein
MGATVRADLFQFRLGLGKGMKLAPPFGGFDAAAVIQAERSHDWMVPGFERMARQRGGQLLYPTMLDAARLLPRLLNLGLEKVARTQTGPGAKIGAPYLAGNGVDHQTLVARSANLVATNMAWTNSSQCQQCADPQQDSKE